MSRYTDADEFTKHIKNGSPVIFDYETINKIIFAMDTEPRVDAEPVVHAHWMMTCDTLKKNVLTVDMILCQPACSIIALVVGQRWMVKYD